jgi:hypothetical protein
MPGKENSADINERAVLPQHRIAGHARRARRMMSHTEMYVLDRDHCAVDRNYLPSDINERRLMAHRNKISLDPTRRRSMHGPTILKGVIFART